jgi:hypothetical protein
VGPEEQVGSKCTVENPPIPAKVTRDVVLPLAVADFSATHFPPVALRHVLPRPELDLTVLPVYIYSTSA